MPFSSTSVEPDLQPVIELAFEAAWRELRLMPGRVLTSHHEMSTRAGWRAASWRQPPKANVIHCV